MKIELIQTIDSRKNNGASKFQALGFKLIPENKEDETFLKEFDILFEDVNGYIEHDAFDVSFTIETVKGW
jgi:hypothetical protein